MHEGAKRIYCRFSLQNRAPAIEPRRSRLFARRRKSDASGRERLRSRPGAASAAVRNDRREVNDRKQHRNAADEPGQLLEKRGGVSLCSHYFLLRRHPRVGCDKRSAGMFARLRLTQVALKWAAQNNHKARERDEEIERRHIRMHEMNPPPFAGL